MFPAFEDEEVLEEIVAHQSSSQRDPYSQHDEGDEDLHLGDDFDQPVAPPKKKKAVKKKKPLPTSATELAPPQYSTSTSPSPTAFALPPSTSDTSASSTAPGTAASAHAKKYLNNVTTYFNDKREQFGKGRSSGGDPEVSGQMDDFALREAALKRREAEILAQEQKIAERERQVRQSEGHVNNWPFKRWSILYHSIPDDILLENQRFIKGFYYLWLFELFCFGWQFIAVVCDVLDGGCSAGILTIVLNAFFCVVGLFGSWLLWYKVIYDASKKAAISSFKYGRFWCGFSAHYGWAVVMFSGVWASDGIMGLLQTVASSCTASSIFFVIGTIAWGVNILVSSYMAKQAYAKYKAGGGNFNAMKSDFTKEAAKVALSRA